MGRPLIIYHRPCNDGWCAAWVLSRAFNGDAELLGVSHTDDPPIVDGRTVIMVDVSFSRDAMLSMHKYSHSFICLDHHKSAKEELYGLPFCIFDQTKSGAMLAMQWARDRGHLFNITNHAILAGMDTLVRYVQDRDLFKNRLPWTHEVSAALRSYEWDLEVWDSLASQASTNLQALKIEGESILRYKRQLIRQHVGHASELLVAGHRVPAVLISTPDLTSDVLAELAEGQPFAVSYCPAPDGTLFCSLRSDENGLDVSAIAKEFGGGGHKNAAGFRSSHEAITSIVPVIKSRGHLGY